MCDRPCERLLQRRADTDEHEARFLRCGEFRRCEECVRVVLEPGGRAMPAHVVQPIAALQLGHRLGVAADNGQRFVAIDDGLEQALSDLDARRVPRFRIVGRRRIVVGEPLFEVQRGRRHEEKLKAGAHGERLHGGVHAVEALFIWGAAVVHAVH